MRSGEQPVSLTNLAQIEMLDLLCSLPVEQAEKKTALWKTPDTEYRITFANGLLYRVQQLKNKLRLWSSDMDFLLEYTLSKENQERLNERTQFEILRQQAGKTNPETASRSSSRMKNRTRIPPNRSSICTRSRPKRSACSWILMEN